MKKIYICQGDENRAKIEEELEVDIFFVDVYRKAAEILKELIEESREYKKVTETVDCENTQYQRIGNNVIAFCASRGQGKTSAMKSFAKYLSKGYGKKNKILDQRIPLENEFVVLDSVDPAALDSGESLIRVVISRIFYLLDKKYKKNHGQFKSSQEKKNRLLELFQECYGSIDYLRKKRQRDDGQDDLEQLAALGNSARLKMKLTELIESFLEIYTDEGELVREIDKKNKFLVVPIDDVDICTGDIYECCEEIRNYLTLPNVIVLLAVDYAQLHRVIFQKYLQINKELVQYEKNFERECTKQASGYLLKLLPNNHVIELPEFVSISGREWKELRLVYYKKAEDGAEKEYEDILEGDLQICRNLQEQIIKIIYDRTGIILWDDEERFWNFLPQTMRELTQLIKKLTQGSGSKIDQQKLYCLDAKDNPIPDEDQVNMLLNNIYLFKNFFLDNWCINCMTPMQYTEFRTWIRVLENRKRSGIFNFKLDDMLWEESHVQTGDVNDVQNENHEVKADYSDEMPPRGVSGDLIAMYLTIFLNEWFAEALQDKEGEQYKRIVDFLDGEDGVLQYSAKINAKNNTKTKYGIYYFPIDDQFLKIAGVSDKFIKHFCVEKGGKLHFDFFNPWRFILLNGGAAITAVNGEEGKTSETENKDENVVASNKLDLRMALKTIISNCGIYSHILKKMKKNVTKENNMPNWRDIVNNFFYENDIWLNHLGFLQLKTNNIELLVEYYRKAMTSWDMAFISDKNNQTRYYTEYKKYYGWLFNKSDISDKEMISFISNWGNTNYAVIRDLSVENCKGSSRLKEMVLSQQAILSKQEEIVELCSQSIGVEYDLQKIRTVLESIRAEYQQLTRAEKNAGKKPNQEGAVGSREELGTGDGTVREQ